MSSLWFLGSKGSSAFSPCRLCRVFFWSSSPTGTSSCRMFGMLILSESLVARHSSECAVSSSICDPMVETSSIIALAPASSPDFFASAMPLAASFLLRRSWSTSYWALLHSSSSLMTSSMLS